MLVYTQLIPCGKVKSLVSSPKCYLSEHTVRNYLFRIFDKLGISSRVELVLYAFSGVEGIPMPTSSGLASKQPQMPCRS
jgi:hypothetical protein